MLRFQRRLLPQTPLPLILFFQRSLLSSSSSSVAIFWDLNSKLPTSIPIYDAAVRLHLAATSFGPLRLSIAYSNSNPVSLHRKPTSPSPSSFLCRVCGRNFFSQPKLLDHFERIHEREQAKRLARLASARGGRRVRLAAELSLKISKYEKAARELHACKAGYNLADELRRAGVRVKTDRAIKDDVVDAVEKGSVGCLMLVSDSEGLVGAVREAKRRCLKTVVVGEKKDGELKRLADVGFLWREVLDGKARKEAPRMVGRWNDRELLKRLEWSYEEEKMKKMEEDESDIFGGDSEQEDGDLVLVVGKERSDKPWWKLDSDSENSEAKSK
ncbi:uncharacterized protein [Typha latifolia]|uniref:uncharacterized protein n=1 Tax=Typha latifolia TaxID=4733 RepID=UPI003C2FF56D